MKNPIIDLIYLTIGCFLLPVVFWRKLTAGRPIGNPLHRLLGLVPRLSPEDKNPVIWFHAVSVGEVNQLETVVDSLIRIQPECRVVISTTTATGMQLARKKYPDRIIFYFPMDFSWAVKNALRRIRPALLVLTELELWPNLIDLAGHRNIPVTVINGRLSDRSFRGYRRFSRLARFLFARLALVITQDKENARRFEQLGTPADQIHVVGSLKYDHALRQADVCRNSMAASRLGRQYEFGPDGILWVAGSTQEPEEAMAGSIYQSLVRQFPRLRLAIVPRHPHRADEIERTLISSGLHVVRHSRATNEAAMRLQPMPVLLLDTIGELGELWSLSRIAFVGGSFGSRGGQNMLEPAAAGKPTCFGPNTWNFSQIVRDMIDANAAVQVNNQQQLERFVAKCLADMEFADTLGETARNFVASHAGATDRTVQFLSGIIGRPITGNRSVQAA